MFNDKTFQRISTDLGIEIEFYRNMKKNMKEQSKIPEVVKPKN